MREKFIELECKTIEEGLQKGMEFYEVDKEKLKIEILEEGKRGIFGSRPYKVRISLKEELPPPPPPQPKAIDKIIESAEFKSEEVEGNCGIYYFEPDGVYLSVYPPLPGRRIEYVDVLEEVNELGFIHLNMEALSNAVEKPNTKILIAPPQPKKISPKKLLKIEESWTTYTFKEDGIYLRCHPPFGKEVSFNDIWDKLKGKNIKNLDPEAIKVAIAMKDEEIKIAPPQEKDILENGKCDITISDDEMLAYITIYPPFGGKAVDKDTLREALKEKNIITEISEDVLNEAIHAGENSKVTLKITGIKPRPGKDATFEYLFSLEKEKIGPEETEDGRVDYRELGLIENVTKGTVLVKKIPPTLGTPGLTVTGKEIPPLLGKDIPLPQGKNTYISEDGLQLIAEIDGCPRMVGDKVIVDPIYTVSGNVDFHTGNIEFVGGVIVKGNVSSGFAVRSGGDVEILGNVEEAIVEAAGKINIRGGAYGRGKTFISAQGDVIVRFAENVTIKSKANVKIGESILHSNVTAGKKVIVSGKKGLIVGGKISAVEEVKAKTIGNYLATPTEIEVGVNPELREELKNIEKKIEIDQDNLNRTQNAIESLKNLQKQVGDLPPAKKELLLKLTRTQFQLMAQIKASMEKKAELEEASKETIAAKISAADRIYPGVKVTIKRATHLVQDELKYVTLFEKNNEVKIGTYR